VRREGLVRDTGMRVSRQLVCVLGETLNGQTTKGDAIASEEGEGLFTVKVGMVKDRGLCRQLDLGHVPKVYREPIKGFHDLLRQKPPSLLML
jgi:hypothetical protein